MRQIILLGAVGFITILAASDRSARFARYPAVESYTVRSGILMVPKYAGDGEVCEIGLEPLHFHDGMIEMGTTQFGKQLAELFDELAPIPERGRRTDELGDSVTSSGGLIEVQKSYENVEFATYNSEDQSSGTRDVVAVIKWTKRKCQ